jgi:hypothetical protein
VAILPVQVPCDGMYFDATLGGLSAMWCIERGLALLG